MIYMVTKTSIAAVAALAFGVASASAATVVNGSFEQDAGLDIYGQDQFSDLASGSGSGSWSIFAALPGWTAISGAGIEIQTANTLGTIDPQDGLHYVELDSNNNSGMQQTINFTNVGRYLLSFFFSPRDGDAESNIIDYSLVGASTVLSGSVTGPVAGPPATAVGQWTKITAEFLIADVGSYDLRFVASGKNNSLGGFIDNVSIAAVPVPAAGFLLIGALGGLAALRRRKTA